jgi:hypothetical protein
VLVVRLTAVATPLCYTAALQSTTTTRRTPLITAPRQVYAVFNDLPDPRASLEGGESSLTLGGGGGRQSEGHLGTF